MSEEHNMLEEMIEALMNARSDFSKFYEDGNSAAGTRVRKAMQEVKAQAHTLRLHIQETKNNK
jgi:hypothetical protein